MTQRADLAGTTWAVWLLFAVIVTGAPLTTSFDRAYRDRGFATVLLAVTIAGAFSTLPDTEEILVLSGVMIPLVLLAWPKVLAGLQHDLTMSIAIAAGVLVVATGALAAVPAPRTRRHGA